MGFTGECQGIMEGYINVYGAWDEHLKNTRNFILDATAGKKINNLAVLGSGWLLDLPLDELSLQAVRIQLYDIIHPLQVLHRIKRYGNVTAISADITGGSVIKAWRAVREYDLTGRLPVTEQLCNCAFHPETTPDYTISLNIISQLGDMISSYLQKHIPSGALERAHITELLQQNHLKLLECGRSCMITDVMETEYDLQGRAIESVDTLKVPLPVVDHKQTWDWQFDPTGGYQPDRKTVLKVMALEM
jgi:hypothetical protein